MFALICDFCGGSRGEDVPHCTCVPSDYWSRPEVREALQARDAPTLLRLLLRSTSLTHEALAIMCGVAQSTITRAVNGRGLTRPDVIARVLARLGAPHLPSTESTAALQNVDRGWEHQLGEAAADTRTRIRALQEQAASKTVLDTLEADVDRLCRAYVHTPLHSLYPQISACRRDALALLDSLTHPDQARRAHIAATRLVGLHAHVAMDVGSYTTALVHADAARELAERTGDSALQAWVYSLHSLIAYWDNRFPEAQRAAEAGLAHHTADSNLARLHALRARAAAAQGDVTVTRAAITAAEDHCDLPVLPGILGFPTAKIHTYAGTSLLALGPASDRRRSFAHTEQAITMYATGADRSVGDLLAARLDLATAHLFDRNPEGTLEQIRLITTVPAGHRTASISTRAHRLLPLLAHHDTAPARWARELLIEFTRTPGPTPKTNA